MHLTTISSQLNIPIRELRDLALARNIHIPPRATKVDNQTTKLLLELSSRPKRQAHPPTSGKPTTVRLPAVLTVRELSELLHEPVTAVIKELLKNGVMASINESLDFDTAAIIAQEFGVAAEADTQTANARPTLGSIKEILNAEKPEDLQERPAIVAVMGHVNHGKTTLLDAIRQTSVVKNESGGITQHIGAYSIIHRDKPLTFLDTPGHEAFTAMRARGASITDMIVLVVAADDGVKPQTVEVINRAKLAQVPIVVAINKIDAPGANTQRVLQELATAGVLVEAWGGQTLVCEISARDMVGIDKLLDTVQLQAELLDVKANPNGKTIGSVIEAHVQTGRGPVATAVMHNGKLNVGDNLVAGETAGRVKSLLDDKGKHLKSILPGFPVQISGLAALPDAGDILYTVDSLEEAKRLASLIGKQARSRRLRAAEAPSTNGEKQVALIIKADVAGSLETIKESLEQIKIEDVRVKIVDAGIGNISDSDIMRAAAARARVIAFRVKLSPGVLGLSKQHKVAVDQYEVIYELLSDITDEVLSLSTPEYERKDAGKLKVTNIFRTESDVQIIGGKVTDGEIMKNLPLILMREGEELGECKILELQQQKTPSVQVSLGQECGMKISSKVKVKPGDTLVSYTQTLKAKNVQGNPHKTTVN